ncbi:putative protein 3 [Dougjudy virga-like virus]|nr:putative protein 3 [Dougjudy virga-like virus]
MGKGIIVLFFLLAEVSTYKLTSVNFQPISSIGDISINTKSFVYSDDCFLVTADLDYDCDLPSNCKPVIRTHIKVSGMSVIVCIGHFGRVSTGPFVAFTLYPLVSPKIITDHVLWATKHTSNRDKYLFVPKPLVSHFNSYEDSFPHVYVDGNRVCVKSNLQTIAVRFFTRSPEPSINVLNPWALSSVAQIPLLMSDYPRDCSIGNKHGILPPNCTMIPVNYTHAVCENVWFSYKPNLCYSDYELKRYEYKNYHNDVCKLPSIPTKASLETSEDPNWFVKAVQTVVEWLFTLVKPLAKFLIDVVSYILDMLWEIFEPMYKKLFTTIISWDNEYLIFEMILLTLTVTYRSNVFAGVLTVVVFGLVFGYNRRFEFQLLTWLHEFTL